MRLLKKDRRRVGVWYLLRNAVGIRAMKWKNILNRNLVWLDQVHDKDPLHDVNGA